MDRKAMYKLSYGLFILTAKEAEKDNGCIINTAIQAASEPNQLSICVSISGRKREVWRQYTDRTLRSQSIGQYALPLPASFHGIPDSH